MSVSGVHARAPAGDHEPAWGRADRAAASASSIPSLGARTPGARAVHGRPSERPGASTSGEPVGTSGSRNGRLQCTGPAGGPSASATVRAAIARHAAPAPSWSSGTPASQNQRTASPYSFTWSMVCPAPVSRSSGGRSAVQTINGTRAWCASRTAGWKFAAAVPDVQRTTAGRPDAFAEPEREERRRALVEVHVETDPVVAGQRERERGGARSGREARVRDAVPHPFVDQRAGE